MRAHYATACKIRKGRKVACYTALGATPKGAMRKARAGLRKLVKRIDKINKRVRRTGRARRWY